MRDEADAQPLVDAYAETLDRHRENFGEPPAGTWIAAEVGRCKRTASKPQKCR